MRRHHTADLDAEQRDRGVLESEGWRTTLEYRENHRRDECGTLIGVEAQWRAEAERSDPAGRIRVLAVVGPNPKGVWRRLRLETLWHPGHERPVAAAGR